MEDREFIKNIYHILILAIFFSPVFSYAYSDKTTHPALTQEIVHLFNKYYSSLKLNNEEKELVMKGSIDEDGGTRPLNHFYDPVYNIGLLGVNMTAKDWSQNTVAQSSAKAIAGMIIAIKQPLSYPGDYSWDRAIYDYAHGDKNRALENLGHILHLVEDMTVPPHTRNDQHLVHVDDSPYETYTSQFGPDNFKIADRLFEEKEKPVIFDSLDKYFDSLALYTSNNFFSKDTTPDQTNRYYEPMVVKEKTEVLKNGDDVIFGFSSNNSNNRLVRIKRDRDLSTSDGKRLENYFVTDDDDLILSDYWSILSKKAVLNGAGVMKLFFDEVEKEKKTLTLLNKNKSFYSEVVGYLKDNFAGLFSAFDDEIVVNEIGTPPSPMSESRSPSSPIQPETVFVEEIIPAEELVTTPDVIQIETREVEPPSFIVGESRPSSSPTSSMPQGYMPGFGGGSPIIPSNIVTEVQTTEVGAETDEQISLTTNTQAEDQTATTSQETATTTSEIVEVATTTEAVASTTESVIEENATTTPSTNETSATDETVIIPDPLSVVINEIAWMGTSAANPSDEWMELYNNTDRVIDLTNWTLYAEDKEPYIKLSGMIQPKSYYLLERTDDNTISDIQSDQIYTVSLSNSGEHLILAYNDGNSTTTIDEVPKANNWFSRENKGLISPSGYYSLERYDSSLGGSDWNNWSTTIGEFIQNGKDKNNIAIRGTPRSKNSVSYRISINNLLLQDKTITEGTYIVDRGGLMINGNLTIDPGVVIKIVAPNEPMITVNGTIKVNGENNKPVVFTSFSDDEFGGNTDMLDQQPGPGSWRNISMNPSSRNSYFNNTIFRYGGRYFDGYGTQYKSIVVVNNTNVDFTNSVFENSSSNGLSLIDATSTVSNNIFRNNESRLFYALYALGANNLNISGNVFENNGNNIYGAEQN